MIETFKDQKSSCYSTNRTKKQVSLYSLQLHICRPDEVNQSVLSICLSVCPVKKFEISTAVCSNNIAILKKNNLYVRIYLILDQNNLVLCISSSFPFNIHIVYHFLYGQQLRDNVGQLYVDSNHVFAVTNILPIGI